MIGRVRRTILTGGYPFNLDKIDLAVDASGKVPISTSFLKVALPVGLGIRKDPSNSTVYVWDIDQKDWHDEPIGDLEVVFDIPEDDDFPNIPEVFAAWIAARAAREHYQETQSADSGWLRERELLGESAAMNSIPPSDIHGASGYSALRALNVGGPYPPSGRAWVLVG